MFNIKRVKKISIGISLCRFNPITNIPEIFLVKNKISYGFNSILMGRYNNRNIKHMFDRTTLYEKNILKRADFDQMWLHTWDKLPNEDTELYSYYCKYKSKFIKLKNKSDGAFLSLLLETSDTQDTTWGIPKGRPNDNESYISCAIRELYEETGILNKDYKIIKDTPMTYSYVKDSIIYISKYYIATTDKNIKNGIQFNNKHQILEISDAKWVSIHELKYMNLNHKNLYDVILQCIRIWKKNLL